MHDGVPPALRRGTRGRQPFEWGDREALVEPSLDERRAARLAEIDRAQGNVFIEVPEIEDSPPPPPRTAPALPPADDAVGGLVEVVRRAWVTKYDPKRAARERAAARAGALPRIDYSDVFSDVHWGDPARAITEPWIHSWLMRGAGKGIPKMDIGDLVFPCRTQWHPGESAWLRRRTVVGLWSVESTVTWPEDVDGQLRWFSEAATIPLRRFNFPVPIQATADIDMAFDEVAAFHDRSRTAVLELSDQEALDLARVCGLPADVLTEPDPDLLAPLLRGLDLGPPTVVRKRILDGARASAHRSAVEKAARDVAVAGLRRARMGVVSTELERGLGSDLWARAIEADGSVTEWRVEVKGLSGADPWQARLTWSELHAARRDTTGTWWLVIVTRALRPDRQELWLSASEAARIFTVDSGGGPYSVDRTAAALARA